MTPPHLNPVNDPRGEAAAALFYAVVRGDVGLLVLEDADPSRAVTMHTLPRYGRAGATLTVRRPGVGPDAVVLVVAGWQTPIATLPAEIPSAVRLAWDDEEVAWRVAARTAGVVVDAAAAPGELVSLEALDSPEDARGTVSGVAALPASVVASRAPAAGLAPLRCVATIDSAPPSDPLFREGVERAADFIGETLDGGTRDRVVVLHLDASAFALHLRDVPPGAWRTMRLPEIAADEVLLVVFRAGAGPGLLVPVKVRPVTARGGTS